MKVPPHPLRLSSCVYLPSVNSQGNHFPYMEEMYLLMTTYRQDIMANFKLCTNVLV